MKFFMNIFTVANFYLTGRRHFTATGWASRAKEYPHPDVLESVDLRDKVYVVTGSTSGVGLELTRYLATRGATVYMVCRNETKGQRTKRAMVEQTGNQNINLRECVFRSTVTIRSAPE